jgi:uncharacterized Zn finger protein
MIESPYEFKKLDRKIVLTIPDIDMSLIKRLGKPKFWISLNDFDKSMELIYKSASKYAKKKYEVFFLNSKPKL